MVFEALNNHMTSACGGFGRLGVNGLGVRGANGGESKVTASTPSGVRKRSIQAIHHSRCITVYVRGRNCKLRSDTSRPFPWPNHIAQGNLANLCNTTINMYIQTSDVVKSRGFCVTQHSLMIHDRRLTFLANSPEYHASYLILATFYPSIKTASQLRAP